MATYNILIEGQTINVPEEIGKDDAKVKAALQPFYPDAANAKIERSAEKDGVVTVTVTKRAGSKGAGKKARTLLEHLIRCKGGMNPVISLYDEIKKAGEVNIETLLVLDGRIDAAVEEGEKQDRATVYARQRLVEAQAQPAPILMVGF